jgi:hypothetical protein
MLTRTSAVVLIIFAFLTLYGLAATQTLTGTITDTMCGKKHMSPGKSDADCTRECMKSKGNWTYGLVVANNVYGLTGDNKQFATFAGQRVTVAGKMTGATIAVQTITAAPERPRTINERPLRGQYTPERSLPIAEVSRLIALL